MYERSWPTAKLRLEIEYRGNSVMAVQENTLTSSKCSERPAARVVHSFSGEKFRELSDRRARDVQTDEFADDSRSPSRP